LLNDRTRVDQFTLDIDDLDPIPESKVAAAVSSIRKQESQCDDSQKYEGSSTEKEPEEHAVTHSLPRT
jgi:hypothetical protein